MNALEYILNIVEENKNREFLIDSRRGEYLTFSQLYELACAVAQNLFHWGLKKGDRIAVLPDNSLTSAILYFGCLYAGIIVVPINPSFTTKEIDFIVSHSGAKILMVCEDAIKRLPKDIFNNKNLKVLQAVTDKEKKLTQSLEKWDPFTLPKASKNFKPFKDVLSDDILAIVYTSGTTAYPKGVAQRISNMVGNARLFIRELGLDWKNRFYGILSMGYLGGYYNLLLLPYMAGSSVVITRAFDAQSVLDFWQSPLRYKVNTLWLVPTIIAILMKMDRGEEGEKFCREKIKCALVGTAPLPVKLKKDFEKRYGVILYENYGLSETFFISTESPRIPRIDGSVGKVLPGIQVTILDSEGKALPYGEEGEIYVRTPYIMDSYYKEIDSSSSKFNRDEWFATGDIGMLTPNGDLFITGRKKDLIIRGGVNISPMAIENVVYEHPSIEQAGVVSIPHEIYGEDIALVVRLKEGYNFSETVKSLKAYCYDHLGPARPIEHIFEIEEFPLGPTGKILKRKLRDMILTKLPLLGSKTSSISEMFIQKQPITISGCIHKIITRPDLKLIEQLKKYSTSIISDCLNRMHTMDGRIQSLVRGHSFCGPAVTVEEVEGGNLMSHVSLELVQRGDVLVIDAKGITTRSCWGGLQTYMAKIRGVVGIVVFGSIRDYEDIVKLGIPVYAIGLSPAGPLKGWGGYVNFSISCAGVVVNPGDVIVGDGDGVVVVPKDMVERILPLCQQRMEMEKKWFKEVENGKTTLDIVGLREKIKEFKIRYE